MSVCCAGAAAGPCNQCLALPAALRPGGTRPAGEDGTAAGLIFALSPLGGS